MKNNTKYQDLKRFARNVKKNNIRKKKSLKIDKNKNKNKNKIKKNQSQERKKYKTRKYKLTKTKKNDTFLRLNKNKKYSHKNKSKNQFNFNEKDKDFNTEYLLDQIEGGGLFSDTCKIPKIKSIESSLNKIKLKKFTVSVDKFSSKLFESKTTLFELQKKYKDFVNHKRKLFNVDFLVKKNDEQINPSNPYKKLLISKIEVLKAEKDQVELNDRVITQDVEMTQNNFKAKKEKNKKYVDKFREVYKKYKKILDKIKKNQKLINKLVNVRLDYNEYMKMKNNPNFQDPKRISKEAKKLLKRGKKCELKWEKIVQFYNDTFQSKNEILNKCLNLISEFDQIETFQKNIEKEKQSTATILDSNQSGPWVQKTEKIYDTLVQIIEGVNDNSITKKLTSLESIKSNITRAKEILETTSINQIKNFYLKSIDILLKFVDIVITNLKAVKEDLKKIFDGMVELWDYKYMRKILFSIIGVHYSSIHRLIIILFFFENISNESQIQILSQTIRSSETPVGTRIDYRDAIRSGNEQSYRQVNQPANRYLPGTPITQTPTRQYYDYQYPRRPGQNLQPLRGGGSVYSITEHTDNSSYKLFNILLAKSNNKSIFDNFKSQNRLQKPLKEIHVQQIYDNAAKSSAMNDKDKYNQINELFYSHLKS